MGIHLVGGVIGSLLVGVLASQVATGEDGIEGLLYGGGLAQLGRQTVAVVAVFAFSFVVSYLLGVLVDRTIGFRISEEEELQGVDETTHAETGYELGGIRSGGFAGAGTSRATSVPTGAGQVKA